MTVEVDYKEQLRKFWYEEYMVQVNPKPSIKDIEKLKEDRELKK